MQMLDIVKKVLIVLVIYVLFSAAVIFFDGLLVR